MASLATSAYAMYSASVDESAMVDCLQLFHETATPFMMNTYPLMDLHMSLSFA